jgi:HD-GYP domain-containing protein (c-di-GMP phosphodiesterase class II)/putative methionine-R-sulfoxide reductase with GAF domain
MIADQLSPNVEILYRISQATLAGDNLADLCRSIHAILNEILPASDFYIALYDPASDTLSFPYYVDEFDPQPGPQKLGRGVTAYVLRTGAPLLATPEHFSELVNCGEVELDGAPSIDWLGVPLFAESRLIGVMAIQSYTYNVRYGQREIDMLEFVSAQVGMAIERQRSVEAMRQRLEELTVLHGIAAAAMESISEDDLITQATQLIIQRLYVDDFGIMLLDEVHQALVPHPSYHGLEYLELPGMVSLGQGITGQVAQTGQAICVSDVSQASNYLNAVSRTRSELCVPLKASGRVIGVINAESTHLDAFSEADQRLLETLAGQLATAIERLRVLAASRRHVERLNALRIIDRAINGNLDQAITLYILLDQTVSQLGVDAAAIYLMNTYRQTLDFAAGKGFRNPRFERSNLRLLEGRAALLAVDRTPVYIHDFQATPDQVDDALRLPGEDFSAYFGVPIIAKEQVRGILEVFCRKPLQPDEEWLSFLTALAGQAAIAVESSSLYTALQRSNQELAVAYEATLEGWSRALELRDYETEGHTRRVTDMTLRLAERMSIGEAELIHIRRGCLLHDIGKLGISDDILKKPGPLSPGEWETMQRHPTYAFEMIYPVPYLRPALDIPYRHHEKWDGTGYPAHLKGEQIPLAARIFTVVDVWDAITSDRHYRPARTRQEACEYIKQEAGQHFDPRIVEIFLEMIAEDGDGVC